MLRAVYFGVLEQHDLRLVGAAALICLYACFSAANLFIHAEESRGSRRVGWLSAAALVFGAGLWATHFVAALAYRPGIPLGYDLGLTALSIVTAMAMTWLGLAVALHYRAAAIGGAIVGAAVGAMHYVGMAAVRGPADLHWNLGLVVASVAIGVGLAAAALRVLARGPAVRYRIAGAALLAAAACGVEFTAMAAVVLAPDPLVTVSGRILDPELLAVAIAAVTVLIITLSLSAWIVADQTARRALAQIERLRRSVEHLTHAQRIAATGSIAMDYRTGRLEGSKEVYRIMGLDRDSGSCEVEFILQRVHPDDREKVASDFAKARTGVSPSPLECRIIRPDGTERIIYREIEVVFDDSGVPVGHIGNLRDITELRAAQQQQSELERQLRHSQRLEALGTLAGGIAHDLNNTLVPILALSNLALEDLPDGSPVRADIETVVRASERARNLVKQILTFGRKQELIKQEVDLAAVTREALHMMRATLPATIEITESISAVPVLIGDPGQLHQVVVNLMTNAAQAIGTAIGRIAVTVSPTPARRLDPNITGTETAVSLAIADTGCGMDAATLDHIFEPFFTTKEVGFGTGLGLSVVHGIVSRHGGRIEVRSKVGEGTEFSLLFPVVRQKVMQVGAAA